MPTTDPLHATGHLMTELLAAIILIAAGAVVLGLAYRRRQRGLSSPAVTEPHPDQPPTGAGGALLRGAIALAVAGAVTALAPLLRGDVRPETRDFGGAVGVLLGGVALALLIVRRFGLPRLDRRGVGRLRTALSIGLVPLVTLAVIAVVVILAAPSGVVTLPH